MHIEQEQLKSINKYTISKYARSVYNFNNYHHSKIRQFCDYMDYKYIQSERKIITDDDQVLYVSVINNEIKNKEIIKANNYFINKSYDINKTIEMMMFMKNTFNKNQNKARFSINYLIK